MLVLLLVQFGLGMAVNLFVRIPARHPGAHPSAYLSGASTSVGWALSHSAVALASHAGLGLLLVVAGLVLLGMTIAAGRTGPAVAAVVGVLAVIGAGFNGASFLSYNHDVSSYVMALLFALAVLCYVVALFLLPRPADP
ncbi:MAG: hypothetical protein ACRD0L_01750 [Acidimicrobiales bacterium]